MDTKTLFAKISQKMQMDFEASSQINHAVSKGTVRENSLRNFLAEGRLPGKYGIGSGEVVGRVRETSKQCDIIIHDKMEGVTLLYDDSLQVHPIDSVYGIIEVKSALSKAELLDALEKIKTLKAMTPKDAVVTRSGGLTISSPRPAPFGAVFAYNLSGNSIDSLTTNLREWEKITPPHLWPNYICVLGVGCIYHHGKPFEVCLDSESIDATSWPIGLSYGDDSLFRFYSAVHDMCARMKLGPVELRNYYEPAIRVGKYIVRGRIEGKRIEKGEEVGGTARLSESAIDKIIGWCVADGSKKYRDVLLKQLGSLPQGMETTRIIERDVFFYNPDNLPGLHELGRDGITTAADGSVTALPSAAFAISFETEGNEYIVVTHSLTEEDWDDVPT